jgi:predicted phage terminase large subunit-like protein
VKWDIVYKGAYNDDGSLFFPEKLSQEFLDNAKKTMGSYLFSNQYLNEIIPSELQTFRKEWIKYYTHIPKHHTTFITIDPALSEADTSDYTGVVVCHIDYEKRWYVSYAQRHRVSPTKLVDLIFRLDKQFKPNIIGIEQVSYQKALLYFLDEEMRRRDVLLPVTGIQPPNQKTKQMRILSLVPRFEWGHIHLSQGLQDLELELLKFPRGAHDDLIDALAYIDYIAYPPQKEREFEKQPGPQHPDYERWYIQNIRKKRQEDE